MRIRASAMIRIKDNACHPPDFIMLLLVTRPCPAPDLWRPLTCPPATHSPAAMVWTSPERALRGIMVFV